MRFSFEHYDFVDLDFDTDKLAVSGDDGALSWSEFREKVNALCQHFDQLALRNLEKPVIIYGHKSKEMLVAIYAMMKMRQAYIPIDVIYPRERLEKIIQISEAQLLLNTTSDELNLNTISEMRHTQDDTWKLHSHSTDFGRANLHKDPLVYIIFTSGSTGEPKGVQITTEAIGTFTRWMTSDFGFTSSDVFVNTAILSFDLSVFEVMTFGALGASIILTSRETLSNPKLFLAHIQQQKGSVLVSTPSFVLAYSRMKDSVEMHGIKTYLFCGEVLPNSTAKNLRASFPHARIINTYGPTEATVATTIVEINDETINRYESLPVGVSKPESDLLIEEGEIVIVGPNVSIGYVNNPELNAAKFVTRNGQRAFKTGDHGYLENGMLFFHGRNDDLVKLHGYRIELNEITEALHSLNYVSQAATIPLKREGIVKKIVSLVQLKEGQTTLAIDDIKADLARTLPHYMIPSDIKFLDQIPLNANGKADKKLLTEIYLGNS